MLLCYNIYYIYYFFITRESQNKSLSHIPPHNQYACHCEIIHLIYTKISFIVIQHIHIGDCNALQCIWNRLILIAVLYCILGPHVMACVVDNIWALLEVYVSKITHLAPYQWGVHSLQLKSHTRAIYLMCSPSYVYTRSLFKKITIIPLSELVDQQIQIRFLMAYSTQWLYWCQSKITNIIIIWGSEEISRRS